MKSAKSIFFINPFKIKKVPVSKIPLVKIVGLDICGTKVSALTIGPATNCGKKVTYKADEDPKSVLNRFRNSYYPRIAVTVDMIATGTDVKPLEVLLFMRDVKSVNYFEQMKGRGTRTINNDTFQNFSI